MRKGREEQGQRGLDSQLWTRKQITRWSTKQFEKDLFSRRNTYEDMADPHLHRKLDQGTTACQGKSIAQRRTVLSSCYSITIFLLPDNPVIRVKVLTLLLYFPSGFCLFAAAEAFFLPGLLPCGPLRTPACQYIPIQSGNLGLPATKVSPRLEIPQEWQVMYILAH